MFRKLPFSGSDLQSDPMEYKERLRVGELAREFCNPDYALQMHIFITAGFGNPAERRSGIRRLYLKQRDFLLWQASPFGMPSGRRPTRNAVIGSAVSIRIISCICDAFVNERPVYKISFHSHNSLFLKKT